MYRSLSTGMTTLEDCNQSRYTEVVQVLCELRSADARQPVADIVRISQLVCTTTPVTAPLGTTAASAA